MHNDNVWWTRKFFKITRSSCASQFNKHTHPIREKYMRQTFDICVLTVLYISKTRQTPPTQRNTTRWEPKSFRHSHGTNLRMDLPKLDFEDIGENTRVQHSIYVCQQYYTSPKTRQTSPTSPRRDSNSPTSGPGAMMIPARKVVVKEYFWLSTAAWSSTTTHRSA